MEAVVRNTYGPSSVLRIEDVEVPTVGEGHVLVRVRAVSVNPAEWYAMTGTPYVARLDGDIRRPKTHRLGADFAGVVEAVGPAVTRFAPGDEVFGGKLGAFAEFVSVPQDGPIVAKPANVTFEQAAAVPTAGTTALQGLRDWGAVRAGQKVLINGASGGVGTFAVQVAKALGAEVTGVCSTGNVDLVRSLGADRVIDYTRDDFSRGDERYDVVLDVAGGRPWSAYRRVLGRGGALVIVGAMKGTRAFGPLGHIVRIRLASLGSGRRVVFFIASFNHEDMATLRSLMEEGKVTPAVDRTFDLHEISAAMDYLGEGTLGQRSSSGCRLSTAPSGSLRGS